MLFTLYRWAIYFKLPLPFTETIDNRPLIRLENAPFTSMIDNRPSWSLHAGVMEFDRIPGGALSNIRSATLTQITEGRLYSLPSPTQPSPKPTESKQVATFRADKGEYTIGQQSALPYDLSLLYALKWKFILSGNVGFQTDSGMELKTPQLELIELQRNSQPTVEQRILCHQGATLTYKEVTLYTNQTRFNPTDKLIECTDGVRTTFAEGTLQTDKIYWNVKEQQLYCPGNVTGTWRKIPFVGENMTIDLKTKGFSARNIRLTLNGSLDTLSDSIKTKQR